MKINSIFAVVEDSLYSVLYKGESTHELRRLFGFWNDASELYSFFEEHEEDLKSVFWDGISIEDAIKKTREDAGILEKKLIEIAEKGKQGGFDNLSGVFMPLSKGKNDKFLEKDKAKGSIKKSWIRVYAIRFDVNVFVVSGGGIKLTGTMNDRKHLLLELEKLEITKKYLEDNDLDGFELT